MKINFNTLPYQIDTGKALQLLSDAMVNALEVGDGTITMPGGKTYKVELNGTEVRVEKASGASTFWEGCKQLYADKISEKSVTAKLQNILNWKPTPPKSNLTGHVVNGEVIEPTRSLSEKDGQLLRDAGANWVRHYHVATRSILNKAGRPVGTEKFINNGPPTSIEPYYIRTEDNVDTPNIKPAINSPESPIKSIPAAEAIKEDGIVREQIGEPDCLKPHSDEYENAMAMYHGKSEQPVDLTF
jgi:hypothetical protein